MMFGGRIVRSATIAAALASTITGALAAQVVRGTVSDSASRQPIPGAVVMLLDSAGSMLGRNITSERGEYRVASARVARSLRVVRIGFQPRDIPFADAADPQRSLDITMVPFKTTLAAVRVTEQSNCPHRADRATAFAFWEQARAGLLNTVVAREANPMSVHRLYFSRVLNAENESIKSFVVSEDSARSTETSFSAIRPARDLVRLGFAGDTTVIGFMFGPDADVLLDDAFAEGYCFRLAEPPKARPNQVGVSFAAAKSKRGRVDIDGTLWIDTVARVLRDVDFRYVGMHEVAEKFHPGGTISFAVSANGVAFIDRWSLRLVGNAPYFKYVPNCRACAQFHDSFYPTENGAEVSHAVWPDGRRWDAPLGTVSIRAVTAAGQPASGAVVQLADSPYRATVDSSGTVVIHDLLPGPYALRIRDPRTAEVGFLLPTPVTFVAARDSVTRLTLDVPTTEEYVTNECQKSRQWTTTDSTYLFGRVVDPDNKPVADARVSYALQANDAKWSWAKETFKTGPDGIFQFCSTTLTPGRLLLVRAARSGHPDVDLTHEATNNMTIMPIRVDAWP
jgi:hypothetical protein